MSERKPYIVFLNGPPRSGKDTVARTITHMVSSARVLKMADPLKSASHVLLGVNPQPDAYELQKDKRLHEFEGYSPREFYIRLSEEFIKPSFDDRFFGRVAVIKMLQKLRMSCISLFVIADSGFWSEAQPIIEEFGIDHCLLVHLFRPDTDFKKDSRSYWQDPALKTVVFNNHTNMALLPDNIEKNLLNHLPKEALTW